MPDNATIAARSLLCDRCGAPLEVGPRVRFVTCSHCGARLGVHRTDSAAWTETLEEVAAATGRIESKLDELIRRPHHGEASKPARSVNAPRGEAPQDALRALEEEWRRKSRFLGRRNRNGNYVPMTTSAAAGTAFAWIFGGVIVAIGICAFVVRWAESSGRETGLAIAVVILVGTVSKACWMMLFAEERGRCFIAAEKDYRRRRAELLGEPDLLDASSDR